MDWSCSLGVRSPTFFMSHDSIRTLDNTYLPPWISYFLMMSHLANMDTWKEHLRVRSIGEHLIQWRSLSDVNATEEGKGVF